MLLKTFSAPDVPTALQRIRSELGPDAVIVSTRQVKGRRGAFGLFRPGGVEITAAREPDPATEPCRALGASPRRLGRAYATVGEEDEQPRERTAATATARGNSGPDRQSVLFYVNPLREEIRSLSETVESLQGQVQRRPSDAQADLSLVQGEIAELRYLLNRMSARTSEGETLDLPESLRATAMRLADAGVDLDLIRPGLERIAKTLSASESAQAEYVRECVLAELMRPISVAGSLESGDRRARVLAFVGPTGVGKTTTVAKIAGQHLAKGRRGSVALLTLDTYRVGAFDHLRSYAEILKTQVQVASNAAELDSLIRRNLDTDLVLIDTAGGNPRDRRLMEALGAVIGSNPLIETHLCVSATTKPRDLRDIHERFSALAIEKLVFTKIDETCSGGALYNLLAESGRPLAFMTDGQRVPEDLHLATRESLCRWVMGA
ncbi:flagellar biosynthesis protein FlhF [Candidatus Sumerlaeota bacterium]|nr:flagellar biosynthesis protein FlhF [Candidatus Sumerlaeota bacterium]